MKAEECAKVAKRLGVRQASGALDGKNCVMKYLLILPLVALIGAGCVSSSGEKSGTSSADEEKESKSDEIQDLQAEIDVVVTRHGFAGVVEQQREVE